MDERASVLDVITNQSVRTVFQPIVDLSTGSVVAYEALSRGPVGPLEGPDVLFAAAAREGLLAPLDDLCRTTALRSATHLDWPGGVALFVNVEPQVLDAEPVDELLALADAAPQGLQVVLEITERAISARPAELLACVRKLRHAGWRIALDDVGADDMSLAFMPLLRPDVVKLDLALVQNRPSPDVARIMNAVNAYAERTGAVLLAEGVEDERHLEIARALGARLGQGWLFGRPSPSLHATLPTASVPWAPRKTGMVAPSPFGCLPADTQLRQSTKPLLLEISKHLEQEAIQRGRTGVVVSTFQFAHQFTPQTARRYQRLAEQTGFVAAIGEGLPPEPAPGVRGADLAVGDILRDEWDIVVLAQHFSAALLAQDLGDTGPDRERRFEFALTYDRDVVSAAAETLLSRVAPVELKTARTTALGAPMIDVGAAPGSDQVEGLQTAPGLGASLSMLRRALAATTNGVAIADMTRPDHPLVFVNTAFERLSGARAEEVLGANCRFLQGPDTDPAAVARLRDAIAAGQECRETLLNYRRGTQEPWWNEIYLAPVRDQAGVVTQYVGVQSDVTARVTAQLELDRERARSSAYLAEIETLAFQDPLTGLLNRRSLPDLLQESLDRARSQQSSVGLLYLDVDEFKAINDQFGHMVGDRVLRQISEQLQDTPGSLKVRLGGDEFLVVLEGLDTPTAHRDALRAAEALSARLDQEHAGPRFSVSIGVSTFPDDGLDFDALLHAADRRMYRDKTGTSPLDYPAAQAPTMSAVEVTPLRVSS